jgi:ABC-type sugar transport system permease subunit
MIVPLIWPTLSTMMITGLAGIFGADWGVLLFTQGRFGTYTISYWMYEQVNVYKSLWHASALGQVYTLIAIPIVFGGRYIMERYIENVEY